MSAESFNEVRLEVVKIGDKVSGRKPLRSSCERLGKGEEMKRARSPCGSRLSFEATHNRSDDTFEGKPGSKAPKAI